MPDINTIGTTLACVVGAPSTFNSAGYAALSWTATVGDLVELGPWGDTSDSITVTKIADGRTIQVNGARNGGECPFAYSYTLADPGQVILRAQSNTNLDVSFRRTDSDGQVRYCTARVANVQIKEATVGVIKGEMGVMRINTAIVVV